ncbi:zinc transporter ZupT [Butyricimonas paravirosa]|uniref:zinc transporter ZupT n=1 Tax=Butyricimonas paravirosa TaxID=1472417 RepID=UPI00210ACA00|nr:zinc transporter ZupT [Butyricimonas paravirosa]MCQ4873809.1 zinc transporter ZupT [Butyricimonas paravirosa]
MELTWDNVLLAFALTLFAGLSTGIGSAIAFLTKKTNKKFLSLSLGFSAGVMIYVSFVELFPTAQEALRESYSEKISDIITVISFFGGMGLIAIIDKLIPSYENPHEVKSVESMEHQPHDKKLMRMGIFSALAIGIHNFPEGLATFIAGLSNPEIAYPIAFAIAIHNIPEGIAVSVPIYFATGNRKKAFKLSFLSGLSEPLGAIIGFLLIYTFIGINSVILGVLFALVAGIMVFISLDELLPTAKEYGAHHLSIYGLVAGMGLMAFSLLLF